MRSDDISTGVDLYGAIPLGIVVTRSLPSDVNQAIIQCALLTDSLPLVIKAGDSLIHSELSHD